jgi:YVTN family beta-propeller protein
LIFYFIIFKKYLYEENIVFSNLHTAVLLDGDEGWDYISVDDASGRIYVSHGSMVQVVDESNGTVLGTITGLMGVHGIAAAADLSKGFISSGRDSSVTIFDLKTFSVIDKISTTGRNPDAIQYDPFTRRVFTFNGGSSNSTVIDASTNAVIGTIPLDGKPEFSAADGKGKIYVNIEDKNTLNVINSTSMKVEQTWSVSPGEEPSGLALDNDNHRLFIVCSNKLMVIMDAENGKVITTLPIGDRVDGVGFDSVKKRAYSANGDGTLTVVQEADKNTFKVVENVGTQKGARTTAVDSKTHHIFLPTAEFDPPPEPTQDNPHPRPKIKPGTFVILDVAPVK